MKLLFACTLAVAALSVSNPLLAQGAGGGGSGAPSNNPPSSNTNNAGNPAPGGTPPATTPGGTGTTKPMKKHMRSDMAASSSMSGASGSKPMRRGKAASGAMSN